MTREEEIRVASEKFAELVRGEYERIALMKEDTEVKDYSKLDHIVIGILPGDGIGPIIMEQAKAFRTWSARILCCAAA